MWSPIYKASLHSQHLHIQQPNTNMAKHILLTAISLLSPCVGIAATGTEAQFVAQVEDRAEALANQMHELSLAVRERAGNQLATHLAVDLAATGLPRHLGEPQPQNPWVARWKTRPGAPALDRASFVADWDAYLNYFTSIEDVRFKVKRADFTQHVEGVFANALIHFAIVGRNKQSQRQWIEAKAQIRALRTEEGRWLINRFELESYTAQVARSELFSEVSLPAGISRSAPRFGTEGNQTFLAHGIAAADVDRDGWIDALATGIGRNHLYINQADGTFTDNADQARIQITPPAVAPLFLDGDNDGDVDLFLSAVGFQMYFEHRPYPDGNPHFVDVSQQVGVAYPAQGFSAVTADINQDGWSDIYVASYNQYGTIMPNSWSRAENGTPNLLFVNRGDGTFAEEAAARGVADGRWSYAAAFADLDEDGDQDLYVANDFGENGYYRNEAGRFSDQAATFGLLDPGNGMGVSCSDFDNDGRLDLHVTNMSSTAGKRILARIFPDTAPPDHIQVLDKMAAGNTLFRNLGNGYFADLSKTAGPFGAGWAFGGGFVDFDNDGWEDLHAPNGFISGTSLRDT